jgi:hypothetical protein
MLHQVEHVFAGLYQGFVEQLGDTRLPEPNKKDPTKMNPDSSSHGLGKTSATENSPNTVSDFSFWISAGELINPFDFVSVEHLRDTRTIGMVKEMKAITDAPSHLSNYVSNEFGNTSTEPNTLRVGTIMARAAVMANTGIEIAGKSAKLEINMPVECDRPVKFATGDEIRLALGIQDMEIPIPSGLIEMTNGTNVPVMLDADYLIGPEAAHINVSGISGLATKTSYLMFLMQSIYQIIGKKKLGIIIFNVKQQDLLHVHEAPTDLDERDKALYRELGLKAEPFGSVQYFLPRGHGNTPNSDSVPSNHLVYSYDLADVAPRLDLLFSEIDDPQFTIASIVGYIQQAWPLRFATQVLDHRGNVIRQPNQEVRTWEDLALFQDYPQNIVTHRNSLLRFQRHITRFRRSTLFSNSRGNSVYLGEEVARIQPGEVIVIDIARIKSTEEQAFVIGDVMRSIDEVYSESRENRPEHLIFLIDELNRYAPNRSGLSAVAEQIIEMTRTGRSRGTVLFGAEQFKSAVHLQVNENAGTHAIGRTGSSELTASQYRFLDDDTKNNVTRLGKGELVVAHPVFRQPIRVVFPKPAYRRQESGSNDGPAPAANFMGAR